jgi:hypothetical protein
LRVKVDSLNLSVLDQLVLRVRGDGKRFALSVQTDYPVMAGAYYYSFETQSGQWQEIRAAIRAFQPRSCGRPLSGPPALNASDVRSLGFIISDQQAGPFRLEIDWIKAVKSGEGQTSDEAPDS